MTQEAIRVEDRPRKQAVSILAGDQLAAMQVPGQNEVVTDMAGCLPDSRVMSAQDSDMPIDVRRGFRAGDRDHSLPMCHARDAVVDPLPAAMHDGFTDTVHADLAVVVATNRKNRRDFVELANQVAQLTQLGGTVHQVAPQQHYIGIAANHGIQDLPAQPVGTTGPEVNVADIQQPTRIVSRRESLFADMQGVIQPEFHHRSRH